MSITIPQFIPVIKQIECSARFPRLEDFANASSALTLLEPLKSTPSSLSLIERLPLEVLHDILSTCTLASICNIASTSRYLRARLLRFDSDRNLIAKTWIMTNAPYWVPVKDGNPWDEEDFAREDLDPQYKQLGWNYLRCCADSGSMRNRRRIWSIAEQLEKMADEMCI